MNIKKQQEVTNEVLEALSVIDSSVLVAGGAPRNWYLDMEANDIDIYIRWQSPSVANILKLLGSEHLEWESGCTTNLEEEYQDGVYLYISDILSFTYKGVLFQVMAMKDTNKSSPLMDFSSKVVMGFDTNINKVTYTIRGVLTTEKFLSDVNNKTLTVTYKDCTLKQQQYSHEHHLPKMFKYFPDYKVVYEGVLSREELIDELDCFSFESWDHMCDTFNGIAYPGYLGWEWNGKSKEGYQSGVAFYCPFTGAIVHKNNITFLSTKRN